MLLIVYGNKIIFEKKQKYVKKNIANFSVAS